MITGREKFILVLMTITIGIGGWLYLLDEKPLQMHKAKDTAGLTMELAKDIQVKLKQKTSFVRDLSIIRAAASNWTKDPFLDNDAFLTQDRTIEEQAPVEKRDRTDLSDFSYTGYIQAGNTALAIINGLEYEKGDLINNRGHYLKKINPAQIEVGEIGGDGIIIINLNEPFSP